MKEFEEDDFDENRKLFATEFLKASAEKKVYFALITFFIMFWHLYLRYQAQDWFDGKF